MTRNIPLSHSITSIISTLILIISSVLLGYSAFWGILGGIIVCVIFSKINGFSFINILDMAYNGIKSAYIVLIIMILIGIIISIWMGSGTIPALMYYGFNYLSNTNFTLATFIISSFISLILGTSVGTISTAGIPLMGIGIGIGVPPYVTAGAIVSGAFLGDRTSPMSSSANLTAVITDTDLYENIKYMIVTLIPVLIFSLLFYYLIGKNYVLTQNVLGEISTIKSLINDNFNISPLLLLPPVVIIVMSLLKVNIKYNLISGIILGILLSFIYQNSNIYEIIQTAIFGFNSSNPNINEIISGGGFIAMKGILSIVGGATALYGILEGTNMIKPIINSFIKNINTIPSLIIKTCILSILMDIITLNQTLSIIVPGKSMKNTYKELNVSNNILARTIGDSGTVVAPLIPWNINGLVISVALGASVIKYAPFAILCYLLPLSTMVLSYFEKK
ncbi:Na+/H+ antiporter NhaC family protein [Sporosalibacterium faouarense]|uniref:Na+/H+ antiporter NhaC family protein n=1 Tax=Sporosalibacterium faouarense TaxID=516123 RepID=UPI00141CB07F|nr:Na+/H+ antiporter NhaC family protein [Sporosalibacterium faouarense]MTI46457.1 hypothetical protein [Bacillota bacterium]